MVAVLPVSAVVTAVLVSIGVIVDVLLTSGRGERLPDDRRPLPATSIPSGEVVGTVNANFVPFGVLEALASYRSGELVTHNSVGSTAVELNPASVALRSVTNTLTEIDPPPRIDDGR
jgi:cell division septation protein DedD